MSRLHHHHARLLARIAEMRESAWRAERRDPNRAEMLRDQAAELLVEANELRDLLRDLPGCIADPAQRELWA